MLTLSVAGCKVREDDEDSTNNNTEETEMTEATTTQTEKPKESEEELFSFDELVEKLSPLAAWSFEENGDSVVDKVSGLTGTAIRCNRIAGYSGQGIEIRSCDGGRLDFGSMSFANLFRGKPAATVSMWVMPYVNMETAFRLFNVQIEEGKIGLTVSFNDTYISVSARSSAYDNIVTKTFNYDIYDGTIHSYKEKTNESQWQHIAVTVDFEEKDIQLYVNGKSLIGILPSGVNKIAFSYRKFTPGASSSYSDCIGGAEVPDAQSFNGIIDDVMLFGTALTKEQAKMLASQKGEGSSTVDDEKEVRKIVSLLGSSKVFYKGNTNYIANGMLTVLDKADYSSACTVDGGKAYIPEASAKTIFASAAADLTVKEILGKKYYSLEEISAASGKTYTAVGDMFIVSDGKLSLNAAQFNRLSKFFTRDFPLPQYDFEQSRALIAEMGKDGITGYCQSPAIYKMGDTIYTAMDNSGYTYVYASTDAGKSFSFRGRINNMIAASFFEDDGALYMIGRYTHGKEKNVGITKSTDGGVTWSEMGTAQGMLPNERGLETHCSASPVLVHNGKIYKAFERLGTSWKAAKEYFIVSASLSSNLLDSSSWTVSKPVLLGANFYTSHKNGSPYAIFAFPEEGNAVLGKDGNIYGLYRLNTQPELGKAIIFKLSADGKELTYDASSDMSVIDLDGGQTKFSARYDESTGLYISFVNNVTDDRFTYQRNILSLAVSKDMVNWEIVTTVLSDRTVMNEYCSMSQHAYSYVDWVFDGDDIIICVREAMDDSNCWHNVNYLTFYRVDGYRSLLSEYIK